MTSIPRSSAWVTQTVPSCASMVRPTWLPLQLCSSSFRRAISSGVNRWWSRSGDGERRTSFMQENKRKGLRRQIQMGEKTASTDRDGTSNLSPGEPPGRGREFYGITLCAKGERRWWRRRCFALLVARRHWHRLCWSHVCPCVHFTTRQNDPRLLVFCPRLDRF